MHMYYYTIQLGELRERYMVKFPPPPTLHPPPLFVQQQTCLASEFT